MRKIVFPILIATMITLGCISFPENPEKISTLRIGYQPSTHHIAEMVAAEMGWWQEDLKPFGIIEVKEIQFPTGVPEMQAMVADELDMAYVGVAPPIAAISQGLDAKIVAGVSINGSNLVFRTGLPYNGPQSLAGKSIGTFPPGSIQDITLKKWLRENGVNISEVNIIPMGPGDAVTAIAAGKIEGVFLPHPAPAIIELQGRGRSVVAVGQMWPNAAANCLLVSGKLIREHPDLVEQIIRTHINATDYATAHPMEAARIYSNRTRQDLRIVEYSLKTWDGRWISDPEIEISSVMEYARVNYELNYTLKLLTADQLFDTGPYDKVMSQNRR